VGTRAFTETWIRSLKAHNARRDFTEAGRKGFMLRLWPGGNKTFVLRYQRDGKPRVMTLGTWPVMTLEEAHEEHAAARKLITKGLDPISERERAARANEVREEAAAYESGTVGELFREWFTRKVSRDRKRPEQVERYFKIEVLPRWETRRARDIRKRDVVLLLDELVDRGAPVAANRLQALLAQMFAWGVNRDLLEASPCAGIEKPGGEETPRERQLADQEIHDFWHGLDAEKTAISKPVRLALRLILATAQRPGEVAGAAWSEFDERRGLWKIPAERAKNGRAHVVPLSTLALELLRDLYAITEPKPTKKRPIPLTRSPFILPAAFTIQKAGESLSVRALSRALRNNVDEKTGKLFGVDPFTPHDLRRTAASGMTRLGIQRLHVAKVLNHSDEGITGKVYDQHDYAAEMKLAVDTWGDHVKALVASAPAKVTPIHRATA
jgi:integrase